MRTKFLSLLWISAMCSLCQITAQSVPAGVVLEKDLTYLAPGREEKLDLYQPAGRAPEVRSPAVVIIHGGGWIQGDKAAEREFITATTLAKAGYVCISIEYWKKEKGRWPTNLQDCKNAVRWLRVNAARLQIDPEKIGVIGGSAGGHLALMVAYTAGHADLDPGPLYPGVSDQVFACVNMYGISNLLTRQGTDASGKPNGKLSDTRLLKESRDAAPEKWKAASPVSYIQKSTPPTLTLHGSNDTTVDRDQSAELDRKLIAAGAESKLIMVEGANHAWPLKTSKFDYTGEVVGFFDRHLKGKK
jgi:acetyl esterase/lipase